MDHAASPRILVVEDEQRVASFIAQGLTEEGYAVDVARDGESGLKAALDDRIDLVLLDVRLPFMSGIDVARTLRLHRPHVPIMMLTALDAVGDRVTGLRSGADDYLGKPFEFDELLARIEALLRRHSGSLTQLSVLDGRLLVDPVSRMVTWEGEEVPLTRLEFRLLSFLVAHQDEAVSREDLLKNVWETAVDRESNVVDVYIRYLRKKLEEAGCPGLLDSVRGIGYRMRSGQ